MSIDQLREQAFLQLNELQTIIAKVLAASQENALPAGWYQESLEESPSDAWLECLTLTDSIKMTTVKLKKLLEKS